MQAPAGLADPPARAVCDRAMIERSALLSLVECSRVLIFEEARGEIACRINCHEHQGELASLAAAFSSRDAALRGGLKLEGRRYEVGAAAMAARTSGSRRALPRTLRLRDPPLCALCALPTPHRSPPVVPWLQIHRFHPPLMYGRNAGQNVEATDSTGIAACRVDPSVLGAPCIAVVTYE